MTKSCVCERIKTIMDSLNFQTAFNIFGTLFILLTSTGLWSCMKEIERLKYSTDIMIQSLQLHGDLALEKHDFNKNQINSNYLFMKKHGFSEKVLKKRSAYPLDINANLRNYDPLTADLKDTEDYCWSLIYNRCGGSVPGAPAVGPPGPPGPPGQQGSPGRVGPMGHMGPPGLNGLKGQKGDKGYLGEIGEPGSDGPRGPPGLPGAPGLQGTNGRRGKKGLQGRPGKPGENGMRGLTGQKGEKGEKGDTGAIIGPGGNCTCKGIKGDKGVRGLVGFDGYKGEPGEKGEKGDGMMGFTGTKGEPGKKGEKGDPGFCTVNCGDKYVRRKVKEPQQRYYTKPEESITTTVRYTTPTTSTTTTPQVTTTSTTPTTPSTIPPTLSSLSMACKIRRIGKPTLIRRDKSLYGTVLGDPVQPRKIWLLHGYHGQYLEEYNSLLSFKNNNVDKTYNLQYNRYYGTQHAIYNNSLYYHFVGKQFVVRYDLNILDVTSAAQITGSNFNNSYYLYKDSKTYYDITADENGLWVVYGKVREGASMINIMKLDLVTLTLVKVWKLPIETGVYGNGFIACGILYLIENTHSQRAHINYTYDMYNDIEATVDIPITVPFKFNTMFTFFTNTSNRKHSRLFGWDNGHVLKYPLMF